MNTHKLDKRSFKFGSDRVIPQYCDVTDTRGYHSWGSDNAYPEFLMSLKNKSGKHSSIIDAKARYIGGNGINENGLGTAALEFIKNENSEENLNTIIYKTSQDLELFGGYALEIVWSRDYASIAAINYKDISDIRLKYNDDKYVYYSRKWNKYRSNDIIRYPKFRIDMSEEERMESPTCIVFFNESNRHIYPKPQYSTDSTINCIELEYEISNFHINNIKRGFVPSAIVTFAGDSNQEEREEIQELVNYTFCGTDNAGRIMVNFAESIDAQGVKVDTFQPNDMDKMFLELNTQSQNGIYQGHAVTNPSLFGVEVPGKLGNTKEQAEDLKVFNGAYVIPRQHMIMKVINDLAEINQIQDVLELNQYEIPVDVTVSPTDLLSVLTSVVPSETKKQILIAMGYKEEQADKLVNSLNQTN